MMEGWKEVRFGEITELIKRGIAPKYVEEGGYIVINQKCIRDGVLSFGDSRLTSKVKKVAKEKFVQIGDVLINSTGTGTLGRTAPVRELPGITTVDTHVTILRGNEKVDKLFLGYLASHYEPLITLLGKGATNQIELGASDLKVTKVVIPESKETQRKIASILSAYDDLIENNLKRIKLLEEKAQLTYEEWFIRMKFPGHETTPINIETGLPEGWKKGKLKDFCLKITKGTTPTSLKRQFTDEGINYIKAESYTDSGSFIQDKFAHIDEETHQLLKRSQLQEFDVLVSIAGVLGRVAIISNNELPANTNQAVGIVRVDQSKVSPTYIRYFLSSEYMNKLINTISGQAAQPNINLTQLGSFKIAIPSIEIVEQFHELLTPVFKAQLEFVEQNKLLKEARDILLPRLMTGIIDVEKMNLENLQPTSA